MPATVNFHLRNSTPAWTALTSGQTIIFKKAHNNTVDTNNPMVRPTSGLDYSWQKLLGVYITVGPAQSLLALTTNISTNSIQLGGSSANANVAYGFYSYVDAPGAGSNPEPVAAAMSIRHGVLNTTPVSWYSGNTATSGSPSGGSVLGSHGTSSSVFWTNADWLRLQMEVGTGATGGSLTTFQLIATYNEI